MEPHEWGTASVTYPDWQGTVQIDHRMTGEGHDLLEIAGLDPESWTVIGLEIGGGETAFDLHLIAVSREVAPLSGDGWKAVAEAHGGSIPATQFLVHGVDPFEVVRAISHGFNLRANVRAVAGTPIRIDQLEDAGQYSE